MLPEKKAVYMSILDAAINGTFHIDTEDIIAILGVGNIRSIKITLSELVKISEVYVNRTRNLSVEDPAPPPPQIQKQKIKITRSSPGLNPAREVSSNMD